jgi:antitoxin component of MazEF toxin-antitoxin module
MPPEAIRRRRLLRQRLSRAFAAGQPPSSRAAPFTDTSKGMPRISAKNQVTIPVAALEEAGLRRGDQVTVEPAGDGELRLRRSTLRFEDAFGALTGTFPPGYLDRLGAEDAQR